MSLPVLVLLRLPPDHPRTAQALRAAVGYLAAGLEVTVLLDGPAAALLERPAPQSLRRHLETLRALGQQVRALSLTDLPRFARCRVVPW
ncbi:MAG: hypothetical protein RMK29_14570 [Myxococcales bacterium]|nr:hypothetical protein [Myxococcota bacterium]MDW8282936.1 hypothetical protein [Myxococcales bacterium]